MFCANESAHTVLQKLCHCSDFYHFMTSTCVLFVVQRFHPHHHLRWITYPNFPHAAPVLTAYCICNSKNMQNIPEPKTCHNNLDLSTPCGFCDKPVVLKLLIMIPLRITQGCGEVRQKRYRNSPRWSCRRRILGSQQQHFSPAPNCFVSSNDNVLGSTPIDGGLFF